MKMYNYLKLDHTRFEILHSVRSRVNRVHLGVNLAKKWVYGVKIGSPGENGWTVVISKVNLGSLTVNRFTGETGKNGWTVVISRVKLGSLTVNRFTPESPLSHPWVTVVSPQNSPLNERKRDDKSNINSAYFFLICSKNLGTSKRCWKT
jgi:hypothetical protein